MTVLDLRRSTPAIGAEVRGVDLRAELAPEVVGELRRALLDHQVLFFRDQPLDPVQQARFASAFAPLVVPFAYTVATEHPAVNVIDQVSPRGEFTERWHTDSTHLAEPPLAAVLRAIQLPPVGGDTCWVSMYDVYATLSAPMRAFLDGLTAEHSTEILDRPMRLLGRVARNDEPQPPVVHPVVRVHPETGRRVLFVNRNFTTRIVELAEDESAALLDLLFRRIESSDFHVRFRWEPDSVALWDERCTQHRAIADYDGRRIMQRCMVQGDRPVGVTGTGTPAG